MKRYLGYVAAVGAVATLAACNGPVPVEQTTFTFIFSGVPADTKCELVGSRGATTTGRAPLSFGVYLKAQSYGGEGKIVCSMADGKVYETAINQVILGPNTKTRTYAEVTYLRGHRSLAVVETINNYRTVHNGAFVRVK